ncbi:facilitated trehalose transporter Tret1-2 homolog [Schistocerca serialis cubense]|uniref:facilitated trehalose transporter Tret1-2 homolog n=1 Tax=Schistocerca serialis cubense TaxID=2023355 RepID=UPI00214E4CF4|nr:facilitated trehalose transporter Tret1-2 homolog [Schistocerca serialis cubense]
MKHTKPEPSEKKIIHWQQVAAATIANLSTLCVGCAMGWTSPVLPVLQLQYADVDGVWYSGVPLTKTEGAWMGALLPVGALIGSIPAGFITHRYGRKLPLLAFGLLLFAGWVMLVFYESLILLMVGRFICGLAAAGVTTIAPLYAEEVAAAEIRGALGTLLDLMLAAGLLVVYGVGIVLPVRWLTVTMAVLPLGFCAAFMLMPESPEYLHNRKRHEKAVRAEAWLHLEHSPPALASVLLDSAAIKQKDGLQLQQLDDERLRQLHAQRDQPRPEPEVPTKQKPPTLRACFIVFPLMAFQQLSGVDAILFYTVDIFAEAGTSISPQISTVITGAVQLVGTGASALLVENFGRRPLLIASGVLMSVSHLLLAVHQSWLWLHEAAGWLPLVTINVFLIGFAIGLGPLPWLLIAELLPSVSKKWAAGVAVCISWIACSIMTGLFDGFIEEYGTTPAYSLLGGICIIYTVFSAALVPETRGLQSQEIQQKLTDAGTPICFTCCTSEDSGDVI